MGQLDPEGVEHPICYASRSYNPAEENYSSFDKECLAVVWATNLLRPYLFGNSFTLVTDHEPLKWIMKIQKLTGKLAWWSLLMQEYDFTVIHRAGTDNANAECLIRYPRTSTDNATTLNKKRGEVLLVVTCLVLMVQPKADAVRAEEKEFWEDVEVLRFLQTH